MECDQIIGIGARGFRSLDVWGPWGQRNDKHDTQTFWHKLHEIKRMFLLDLYLLLHCWKSEYRMWIDDVRTCVVYFLET